MRLCGALAFVAGAVQAANYRLSQGQPFSSVPEGVKISPNGVWAVYQQDAENDNAFELWRVAVEGGTPARLCGALPVGESVEDVAISPDSQRVVYTAHEDDLQHLELFSASLANPVGNGLKLNDVLSDGYDVRSPTISPDSSRVVYTVADFDHGARQLWSATLDGSDRDLLVIFVSNTRIAEFTITADSQYVLFVPKYADDSSSLWRVPLTGGFPVELSVDLASDRQVTLIKASPDGTVAAYTANRDDANRFELFRVPVAGGEPLQLSDDDPTQYQVTRRPEFSPDGARVVYFFRYPVTGRTEVWSVEPDGDGNVKLNGVLVAGGTVELSPVGISPDSSRVVYLANQQDVDNKELYSVPIAGGGTVKLNGPPNGNGDVFRFQISSSGTHVALSGDIEMEGRHDLYATPIQGGQSIRLSAVNLLSSTLVFTFALPGSGKLAFYIQRSVPIVGEMTQRVWAAPIGGGQRTRIDGCDAPGELVQDLELVGSPVRDYQVLYVANQESSGQQELYVGDTCLLCNGFEGTWRWSSPPAP
jgi:Tol biopolymer transport system component